MDDNIVPDMLVSSKVNGTLNNLVNFTDREIDNKIFILKPNRFGRDSRIKI